MKSTFLLFVFLLSGFVSAQSEFATEKLTIKATYGTVKTEPRNPSVTGTGIPYMTTFPLPMKTNIGLDINYAISYRSDMGVYINYAKLSRESIIQFPLNGDMYWMYSDQPTVALYYGLNYIYHLPFLRIPKNSRLDLYSIIKAGMVSERYYLVDQAQTEENGYYGSGSDVWDKPSFEIGAGVGVNYFFTKNLGVNVELLVGDFYNKQFFKWKTGVTLKF